MKNLQSKDLYLVTGGIGWYPGYNSDDHERGVNLLIGSTVGFVVGAVSSFWETCVEYSK